jgi:light-regulated signal transduction histidine kinase (bacteriophytochrome)
LTRSNQELEAFSYSVSHDLRAPLRAIDGFSVALEEDYGDKLDDDARQYLGVVRENAQLMGRLIDDLLSLSRVTRTDLKLCDVDLSAIARASADALLRDEPEREVQFIVEPNLHAHADPSLIRIALHNLLENAFKFTRDASPARVEFFAEQVDQQTVFVIRDNGAGFDMKYQNKLFKPFQRLHSGDAFPGTGVGLATVFRVVTRHGGRVLAEGNLSLGAKFGFTLGTHDANSNRFLHTPRRG